MKIDLKPGAAVGKNDYLFNVFMFHLSANFKQFIRRFCILTLKKILARHFQDLQRQELCKRNLLSPVCQRVEFWRSRTRAWVPCRVEQKLKRRRCLITKSQWVRTMLYRRYMISSMKGNIFCLSWKYHSFFTSNRCASDWFKNCDCKLYYNFDEAIGDRTELSIYKSEREDVSLYEY